MSRYDHYHDDRGASLTGAVMGAVAGAAAVWVMDRVDWFMFNRVDPQARRRTETVRPGGMDPAHVLANRVAHALGTELTPQQPHPAGIAVHYAIGIGPAALYGALVDRFPELGVGRGTAFGLAMFLLEDELMNPLAGLAAPPGDYPWQAHARGLVAHLAFGFVLDSILRVVNGTNAGHPGHDRPGERFSPGTRYDRFPPTGTGAGGYQSSMHPGESGKFGQAL